MVLLPMRLSLFLLLLFYSPLHAEAPAALAQFADYLESIFLNHTRAHLVEEALSDVFPYLRVRSESAAEEMRSTTTKLQTLFSQRISALKKLGKAAEMATDFYNVSADNLTLGVDDENYCASIEEQMRREDTRLYAMRQHKEDTGIHINVESYACDADVIRDFEWTSTEKLIKVFKENKELVPDIGYQYVGTYSGLTRMYPARDWVIDPPSITVDLFDPTFRPWFVNAESPPKDAVFLIDFSGSMKGPTMHLTKITLMYIMSTLGPNDYFYGVWFNAAYAPVLPCSNRTFLPATTSNKKIFYEKLAELEEKDQAHLGDPLKFSLDALRQFISSDMSWARSGGHKMVMLFTDGIDEWPEKTIKEEVLEHQGDKIRIFGFAMGWGTGLLPNLYQLVCLSNATYSVVDSIADVKAQGRAYMDHLSYIHGMHLSDEHDKERPISWTNLYMDTQGSGPVVTLSQPIPIKEKDSFGKQRLAGVAAIDIDIKEITNALPNSDQMYGFVVDNNGIAIWHPRLQMPRTEVHCVRRSACYDAESVKSKAGAGLRVQYGFSDERVYRLVGLIDSIPTIDIIDLENNSPEFARLRTRIIDRNCTDEPIQDGEREWYCSHLAGTPFTVVVVNNHNRDTIYYAKNEVESELMNHNMVGVVMTRRELCNWTLDSLTVMQRYDAFTRLNTCHNEELTRALGNALQPWIRSWPRAEENFTCESTPFPDNIPTPHFINAFVHIRPKVTAFYPQCSHHNMKEVIRKFDDERFTKENDTDLRFSIRNDIVVVYRPIVKDGNRIAVVGAQWSLRYVHALFRNFTANHKSVWKTKEGKDVLLITKSGWVIAAAKREPGHLTAYDPQLFYSLKKQKMVEIRRVVDVQAECVARRTAPWASPATRRISPIRGVFDVVARLLSTTFWIDLYYLFTSHLVSAQPVWNRSGKCQFQKIKPFERCSIETHEYQMTLNITKQFQLDAEHCPRYLHMFPVPHTTLTLISTDKPCPSYKAPKQYQYRPKKLSGCEVVAVHYRRKRDDTDYTTSHPGEDYSQCELNIGESAHSSLFYIILLFIFLLERRPLLL